MRWDREWLRRGSAVIFLACLVILVCRGLWKGGVFHPGRFNDLRAYHVAARGVLEGDLAPSYRDRERPNLYPPTFAILVAPLGILPYRAAVALWVILNAGLVVYLFRRLDVILGLPLSPLAKVAGFLLVFRFIESDFANGNSNILVLFLVLAGFDACRRGREATGGAIHSAAILAKVSPVLLLPWALYRRRWRSLVGAGTGLLTLGLLLPLLVLGPDGAKESWQAWKEVTIDSVDPSSPRYAAPDGGGYEPGQSLRALVHRLLRRSDATAHDGAVVSVHLADLSKEAADGVYATLSAAVLGLALLAAWCKAPGVRLGWRAGEIAAACAVMVLLAPISRKAHFVALWPAAVVGFEAWRLSDGAAVRRIGALLWIAALVLSAATSPGFLGRAAATRVLAYCPLSWAAAALLVLVIHPRFFPRGGRRVADLSASAGPCPPAMDSTPGSTG